MLTDTDTETTARYFCEMMGFDPNAKRKIAGKRVENWIIASQQVREHVAMQMSLARTLKGKAELPSTPGGNIIKLPT